MAAYLIDNPPARSQFRRPRRAKPSGVIVVHTAESTPDTVGIDTGAEGVARFIRDRDTPGSYHDLADSDSIVHLVPYDAEAYGDGTGSNPHAYHVSSATTAAKWLTLPPAWREATVRNMARAAARYAKWVRTEHGVIVPARRISRDQSEDLVPGFIPHGDRDPGRRYDPGPGFPWDLFLTTFDELMNPNQEDDDMATPKENWDYQIPFKGTPTDKVGDKRPAYVTLVDTNNRVLGLEAELAELKEGIARIEAAVGKLAGGTP